MAGKFKVFPQLEACTKRIRAMFAGKYLVDTADARLVWEHPYYPYYYFERKDVSQLTPYLSSGKESKGIKVWDLIIGDRKAKAAVIEHLDDSNLGGMFKIEFGYMDAWFEEDEQIFVHPRDPYKRVDILQSSRHVRVEINGIEVANTKKPKFLFETLLIRRTYIPKTDCRLDLLRPSELTSQCPYKGVANYYHAHVTNKVEEDIAWWYRTTTPECVGVAGYIAFYDEKVDVWVDGVKQPKVPAHK